MKHINTQLNRKHMKQLPFQTGVSAFCDYPYVDSSLLILSWLKKEMQFVEALVSKSLDSLH